MKAIVRPATSGDLARLEEIENSADALLIDYLQPDRSRPAPDADARTAMSGFILVVALARDSDAVGFVQVLEEDGNAHLEQLSVLPEFERQGLGRLLVHSAMAEAARRGYASIALRTFASEPWNGPFYASCGFAESEPATGFHRALRSAETRTELPQYARRIQMTARLDTGLAEE